jgi:hypothetical protein
MSEFTEALNDLMRRHRVTPSSLSKATGIPVSTICEWTAGRTPKLNKSLLALKDYFGVSLDHFLGEETFSQTMGTINLSGLQKTVLQLDRHVITIEVKPRSNRKGEHK